MPLMLLCNEENEAMGLSLLAGTRVPSYGLDAKSSGTKLHH